MDMDSAPIPWSQKLLQSAVAALTATFIASFIYLGYLSYRVSTLTQNSVVESKEPNFEIRLPPHLDADNIAIIVGNKATRAFDIQHPVKGPFPKNIKREYVVRAWLVNEHDAEELRTSLEQLAAE